MCALLWFCTDLDHTHPVRFNPRTWTLISSEIRHKRYSCDWNGLQEKEGYYMPRLRVCGCLSFFLTWGHCCHIVIEDYTWMIALKERGSTVRVLIASTPALHRAGATFLHARALHAKRMNIMHSLTLNFLTKFPQPLPVGSCEAKYQGCRATGAMMLHGQNWRSCYRLASPIGKLCKDIPSFTSREN